MKQFGAGCIFAQCYVEIYFRPIWGETRIPTQCGISSRPPSKQLSYRIFLFGAIMHFHSTWCELRPNETAEDRHPLHNETAWCENASSLNAAWRCISVLHGAEARISAQYEVKRASPLNQRNRRKQKPATYRNSLARNAFPLNVMWRCTFAQSGVKTRIFTFFTYTCSCRCDLDSD